MMVVGMGRMASTSRVFIGFLANLFMLVLINYIINIDIRENNEFLIAISKISGHVYIYMTMHISYISYSSRNISRYHTQFI
jgi:hypothetical protein